MGHKEQMSGPQKERQVTWKLNARPLDKTGTEFTPIVAGDTEYGTARDDLEGTFYIAESGSVYTLKIYDGSSWNELTMTGTAGHTLHQVCTQGKTTTNLGGPLTVNESGDVALMHLDKTGSGAGVVLTLDNQGTGDSIYVEDSGTERFSITGAGLVDLPAGSGGMQFADGIALAFGTTAGTTDAYISFDATDLLIDIGAAGGATTPAVVIGSQYNTDFTLTGTASSFDWDWGDNTLTINGADLLLFSDDHLLLGDASVADIYSDGTGLLIDVSGSGVTFGSQADTNVTFTDDDSTGTIVFDAGVTPATLTFNVVDLKLGDGDELLFGDAGTPDMSISYDSGNTFDIVPAADDGSVLHFGDTTHSMDMKWWAKQSGFVLFDAGAELLSFSAVSIDMADDDEIRMGTTGGSTDFYMTFATNKLEMDVGSGGTGIVIGSNADTDFTLTCDSSGSFVWDYTAKLLTINGADLRLLDEDLIQFGDDQDATIEWDQTNLEICPKTDGVGALWLGNQSLAWDVVWSAKTGGNIVTFDATAETVIFENVDLIINDSDNIFFGTGSDFAIVSDGATLSFVNGVDEAISISNAEVVNITAGDDKLMVNDVLVDPLITISVTWPSEDEHVTQHIFKADRAYEVVSFEHVHVTASSSGTLMLQKAPSGTALGGSATDCLSGTTSTAGAADTTVTGTLHGTPAQYQLDDGDNLGIECGGTATSLVGCAITVRLKAI